MLLNKLGEPVGELGPGGTVFDGLELVAYNQVETGIVHRSLRFDHAFGCWVYLMVNPSGEAFFHVSAVDRVRVFDRVRGS